MQNNRLPEIVRRSESGPFVKEADFERALTRRVPELVEGYGLKFDPQILVPADDDMADRLYQAGLDLFIELGVYNQNTERRIACTMRCVKCTAGTRALGPRVPPGRVLDQRRPGPSEAALYAP